jgi:Fe-S-cluster containining protein
MNFQKVMKKRNKLLDNFYREELEQSGCFNCNECHCCKNRVCVEVTEQEFAELKTMLTNDIIEKGKKEWKKYNLTGSFDCPFLNDEGKCSIYSKRPLICASYYVENESKYCENPYGKVNIYNFMPGILMLMGKKLIENTNMDKVKNIIELFE